MSKQDEINQYLEDELTKFSNSNTPNVGMLLELTMLQLAFLRMVSAAPDIDDVFQLSLVAHINKTLQMAALMGSISQNDIDRVVAKGTELVDCMRAIADPTPTNVH